MTPRRNKYYILNTVFLVCLSILFLNDHYLKFAYPNWLTGKLSDAVGIIILPLLLAFAIPRLKQHALWISALLFAFWKSPWSQGLIDCYNTYSFIQTSRTVDYADLIVLPLLAIPGFIIWRIDNLAVIKLTRAHPIAVLLPAIFILMSTEPPPSHYYTYTYNYTVGKDNLVCYNCNITVDYNQDEIVEKLKKVDIVFDTIKPIDSLTLSRVHSLIKENPHVYFLNRLIIEKDTLQRLKFTMRTLGDGKTKIYFNSMQVSADISTNRLYRKIRNYYKSVLFKELKASLMK